jgi:hypothetical protein
MIKRYYYLLDNLTMENAESLKKALKVTPAITGVDTKVRQGVLEVSASRDPLAAVKMACEIAGIGFRTAIKKKDVF